MPQYRYQVKKAPGEPATGVLEAENERAAAARLREMGYFPISIEEDAGKTGGDVLRSAMTHIRLKDRNVFFRQLANLYDSGMPLTRALATVAEQSVNKKLSAIAVQLRDDVQKGSTLAEAMEQHPRVFTALHCSMVQAGESGGMLDEVLWRIVTYGEQDEELRGQAFTAMVYPAFLAVIGSIAVFILVSFVFPRLMTLFDDFEMRLPWPTVVVMAICSFMGSFWWAVLIALALVVAVFTSYVKSEAGRLKVDTLALRVPVVRNVVEKYVIAQFARTLGTLMDNGVPILQSLNITTRTLSNKALASQVAIIEDRVRDGEPISTGLKEAKHFPPMVVNMFAVGEESGSIGSVAKRLADAYDIEVNRAVKVLTSLLEPILVVIMAVVVGFLVIAMLLPILTMSSMVA